MKIKPRWFKGLERNSPAAKALKANYLDSILMRERLVAMLEEDIDASLVRMRDAAKGVIPNLSEYYADELAKQSALDEVIKLIKEK